MEMTFEELKTVVRRLPEDQRAELAEMLLEASGDLGIPEDDDELTVVALQRLAELREGKTEGIPESEVFDWDPTKP